MLLLGITGEKQHGKGTVAAIAREWATGHGLEAVERGFADYVKWSLLRIFIPDITREEAVRLCDLHKENPLAKLTIFLPETKESALVHKTITIRQGLQHEGTEVGRELYGTDFWVNLLLRRDDNPKVLRMLAVSDMRFDNEAEAVDNVGGYVYKVVRPGVKSNDSHVSEAGVADHLVDRVFINDGTIEDLKAKIVPALEEDFAELLRFGS